MKIVNIVLKKKGSEKCRFTFFSTLKRTNLNFTNSQTIIFILYFVYNEVYKCEYKY